MLGARGVFPALDQQSPNALLCFLVPLVDHLNAKRHDSTTQSGGGANSCDFNTRMDGVIESAVIGLADADFGESVTAIVVRNETADQIEEGEIIAALKLRMANFKVPKKVNFVASLPRNTMGKVQKNLLREQFKSI